MTRVAQRVAARYLRAKSIGNARELAGRFESLVNLYGGYEADLQEVLDAKQQADEIIADSPLGEESLDPHDQRLYDQHVRFFEARKYIFMAFPERSFKALIELGVRQLFLALIQQYALSPQHLKQIEQYSKFYAKTRLGRKKDFDEAVDTFEKLLAVYREQLSTVKEILASTKLRGTDVDGERVLDAGPFKVVNSGGFDQATIEKAARIVKEAAKRLKQKGMGKACYGEVHISNQLAGKNTLAFYDVSSDEMFIRADLKGHESEALKTVLHELGHRVHYKFLHQWSRGLRDMYQDIKRGHAAGEEQALTEALTNPALTPKPGDTMVGKKKRVYVVEKVDRHRGVHTVYLSNKEDPKAKASISLLSYLSRKGIKVKGPEATRFVTSYAGKDYEENFAEMVSYYCMDELPDEQVAMLKPYLDRI